jgi:hypothetical protein
MNKKSLKENIYGILGDVGTSRKPYTKAEPWLLENELRLRLSFRRMR